MQYLQNNCIDYTDFKKRLHRLKHHLCNLRFLICAIIIISAALYFYQQVKQREVILEKRKETFAALNKVLEDDLIRFKGEAGIVIIALNTNLDISFNKNRLFPSASLVKVPIMLACFKAAREGKINLKDNLTLSSSYKVSGSGILKTMPSGSAVSIEKLIEHMITDSDNTATNMLIGLLGFDYLNKSFKGFGLKNTNLSRKMMDFISRKHGVENYTTAEDMAYILEMLYRKRFLSKDISERCLTLLKQQKLNDRIPARLPSDTVVAHKTGLERKVCHDAGIVFAGGDFLVCVLTKNAENSKTAKEFIAGVAQDSYNLLSHHQDKMLAKSKIVYKIR